VVTVNITMHRLEVTTGYRRQPLFVFARSPGVKDHRWPQATDERAVGSKLQLSRDSCCRGAFW